jgi:hypothetical protein
MFGTGVTILVWAFVMWRFRTPIRQLRPGTGTGGLIVLIVIWATLISLEIRALFDAGLIGPELAFLGAATVRGLFIICGIALALWGPQAPREQK